MPTRILAVLNTYFKTFYFGIKLFGFQHSVTNVITAFYASTLDMVCSALIMYLRTLILENTKQRREMGVMHKATHDIMYQTLWFTADSGHYGVVKDTLTHTQ